MGLFIVNIENIQLYVYVYHSEEETEEEVLRPSLSWKWLKITYKISIADGLITALIKALSAYSIV